MRLCVIDYSCLEVLEKHNMLREEGSASYHREKMASNVVSLGDLGL